VKHARRCAGAGVRAEQGTDAFISSNTRGQEGIEVMPPETMTRLCSAATQQRVPEGIQTRDTGASRRHRHRRHSRAGGREHSLRRPSPDQPPASLAALAPAARTGSGFEVAVQRRELRDLRQTDRDPGSTALTWIDKRCAEPLKARVLEETSPRWISRRTGTWRWRPEQPCAPPWTTSRTPLRARQAHARVDD